MEAPGTSVLSSIPGTTRTLSSAPTRSASSRPSVLSWSVRAITRTPWACARRTTSPGRRRPSEMGLWRWRSSECMQGRLSPGAVSAISKTRDGYGRLALEEARPHQPRTRLTACGQDGACTHHTERAQQKAHLAPCLDGYRFLDTLEADGINIERLETPHVVLLALASGAGTRAG